MSDYENPRPVPSTPYSDPRAVADHGTTLGKLLNETGSQTTYRGTALKSYQQVINEIEDVAQQSIDNFNYNGQQAINQFNTDGQQAIDDFTDIAGNLVNSVGYEIIGDFADAVKVPITAENQVYSSKSIAGQEDAVWRTNQPLPYTPTGSDPTSAPELGKWAAVALGEIKSIARSLNALDSQVIYSTDTATVLDDVLYIYDGAAQETWFKPIDVGIGETIVSVAGSTLTTSANVYTMNRVELSTTLYPDPIAPTYLKTVSDIINGDEVSIMRFIDPSKHAGIRDQTSTYDGTVDVQSAVDAALNDNIFSLFAPAGLYNLDGGVVVNGLFSDSFSMKGSGRKTIFRTDQAVSAFVLSGLPANTAQNINLSNFAIQAANTAANCLETKNTELMKLTKMWFVGTGNAGVLMSVAGGDSDIKPIVHNCNFGGLQHGILGGDTRQADGSYKDNYFIDLTTSCITMGWADGGTFTGNKMFSNLAQSNAVRGFNLKQPIYCFIEDNDFFRLGGIGMQLTSPRHSRINNNRFVETGRSAALPALNILDYSPTVPTLDTHFVGNTIKDIDGTGVVLNSTSSIISDVKFIDNKLTDVGKSGTVYDGFQLTNCTDVEFRKNKVKSNEVTNKTRYWLNVQNSTDITIDDNKRSGLQNKDLFTNGPVTLAVKNSDRILTNVTATTTLSYDDDGVVAGALTSSITINLPSASACPGNKKVFRWTSGAFSVILDPASTQTIDGAATLNVNSGNPKATIISDGSNWYTI